jgi:hypothetical protein
MQGITLVAISVLFFLQGCAGKGAYKSRMGQEYYFGTKPSTWKEANMFCTKLWGGQGDLARIDDHAENQWVFKHAGKDKHDWLGGNDMAKEGTFVWSDGCAMNYKNFAKNQPDDYKKKEDCVHFFGNRNGKWNDWECSKKTGFVCKKTTHKCAFGTNYYFGSKKSTWNEARNTCKKLWGGQGELARIESGVENQWVFKHAGKDKHDWIGGNDMAKEGTFVWSDGCAMKYKNFAKNQPDDYRKNEDCVHFFGNRNGKWNDWDCSKKTSFVCEVSRGC